MQQLIAFFISVFLFASLFLSSIESISDRQQYRIAKQDLNLLGRDIVNFTYLDSDGNIVIDENNFLRNIINLNRFGDILGGIFFYEGNIRILKITGEDFFCRDISAVSMNEQNKINTVNQMLYFILGDTTEINGNSETTEINISVNNSNDYLVNELYNKLEENTFFIIGNRKGHVFLSGFVVNI